ncbi:hypothetical protein RRG08_014336 [Elysia crispata]|uniref:Uncharacterized protein n=1 Tax=Elysia crispata TaxID=231223 RepID=A0AAE1CJJ8_9GAST|nr:hypothetical protein RRG08_014336 [Elysia crispata]
MKPRGGKVAHNAPYHDGPDVVTIFEAITRQPDIGHPLHAAHSPHICTSSSQLGLVVEKRCIRTVDLILPLQALDSSARVISCREVRPDRWLQAQTRDGCVIHGQLLGRSVCWSVCLSGESGKLASVELPRTPETYRPPSRGDKDRWQVMFTCWTSSRHLQNPFFFQTNREQTAVFAALKSGTFLLIFLSTDGVNMAPLGSLHRQGFLQTSSHKTQDPKAAAETFRGKHYTHSHIHQNADMLTNDLCFILIPKGPAPDTQPWFPYSERKRNKEDSRTKTNSRLVGLETRLLQQPKSGMLEPAALSSSFQLHFPGNRSRPTGSKENRA